MSGNVSVNQVLRTGQQNVYESSCISKDEYFPVLLSEMFIEVHG